MQRISDSVEDYRLPITSLDNQLKNICVLSLGKSVEGVLFALSLLMFQACRQSSKYFSVVGAHAKGSYE